MKHYKTTREYPLRYTDMEGEKVDWDKCVYYASAKSDDYKDYKGCYMVWDADRNPDECLKKLRDAIEKALGAENV